MVDDETYEKDILKLNSSFNLTKKFNTLLSVYIF